MTTNSLIADLHQLAALLQRYFRPSGSPPEMPDWLFPVAEREQETIVFTNGSECFRGLAANKPNDPTVEEALEHIPALLETAELLRSLHKQIAKTCADSRLAHVFDRFLDLSWVSHCGTQVGLEYVIKFKDPDWVKNTRRQGTTYHASFTFEPVDPAVIDELLRAGIELRDRKQAAGANSSKLFPKGCANPDLRDLGLRLQTDKGSGKSMNQTAREFTGETLGNEPRAKRLLANLRAMKSRHQFNL